MNWGVWRPFCLGCNGIQAATSDVVMSKPTKRSAFRFLKDLSQWSALTCRNPPDPDTVKFPMLSALKKLFGAVLKIQCHILLTEHAVWPMLDVKCAIVTWKKAETKSDVSPFFLLLLATGWSPSQHLSNQVAICTTERVAVPMKQAS